MPNLAIASPSPIKKKSRSNRGIMMPEDVIDEEDDEDDDGKGTPRTCPLSLRAWW